MRIQVVISREESQPSIGAAKPLQRRGVISMSTENTDYGKTPVPGTRRKPVPIVMASGPQEYIPGDQELPVQITSLAEMLQWAQNWERSRSVWPICYGLECCVVVMMGGATWHV